MAFVRFCDRRDLNITGREDFRVRPKAHTILVMAVLVIGGVSFLLYSSNVDLVAASQICVGLGLVMLFITTKFEKVRSQLLASEFMNAMFASALAMGCKFCMVVKPDGEIVYFDREFQQMFPDFFEQPKHTLETLFNAYPLEADSSRQKIMSLVANSQTENLNISIAWGPAKATCRVQLSIVPIPRPSGFILLRGTTV